MGAKNSSNEDEPFEIKVKLNEKSEVDVFCLEKFKIKKTDKISRVKEIIFNTYRQDDTYNTYKKYVKLYKDGQLLKDSRKVKSYDINSSSVLETKSTKKGEILLFFCDSKTQVGIFVTEKDKVYDIFKSIEYNFPQVYEYKEGFELICNSRVIYRKSTTVGELELKNFDKVIVIERILDG